MTAPGGDPLEGPFLWGTATSAHQVEGGNHANDWSEHRAPPAGAAADFLHHAEEDLDRARDLSTNAFRFSLEWSRVEPRPGQRDPAGVAFYERLVDGCLARGLRPLLTLVQFTLPRWCRPRRLAWERPDVLAAFRRHVAWVARRFGDRVDLFVTFNEPNVQAGAGYVSGVFPPGLRLRPGLGDRCLLALVRAHALAYDTLHTEARGRPVAVGVSPHLLAVHPSAWDVLGLVKASLSRFDWAFTDAIQAGVLRLGTGTTEVPAAVGRLDFLGVNSFTGLPATVRAALGFAGLLRRPAGADTSDMGWRVDPAGFEGVLREAHRRYGLPIIVTENGVADATDRLRPAYLTEHVAALRRAVADGVDVRGYFHWSLVDNYEWHEGLGPRFGLFAVDYATQRRTPRPSADVYRRLIGAAA